LTQTPEPARLETGAATAAGREEQAMPEKVSNRPAAGPVMLAGLVLATSLIASGCATVQLQAPKEPITINLNVKIDQEVRYRLDKDLEDAIAANPDLF
jgi:hypothetical protein